MKFYRGLFFLILLGLGLCGCAGMTVSLKSKIPESAVASKAGPELVKTLRAREEEITSFRALARVLLEVGGERRTIRQVIAFQRPGLLRIESIPLNSAYAFNILAADGSEVRFLDTTEKFAFVGPDNASTMQSLADIPLEIGALLGVLSGRVPISRVLSAGVEFFVDQQTGRRIILNEQSGELYMIDLSTGLLREVWLRDRFNAKLRARLEFISYQDKNGVEVPAQFTIEIPGRETKMSYELASSSVNKPLPPKVFAIQIPEGYSRRKVEYGDQQ